MTNDSTSSRLRYDEGCLAAHALNLMGDRWALLVVRELMFADKRFQMIRAGLPGISASVLTGRLAQLQDAGVVNDDARIGAYALTEAGRGLRPVLESLCRWALTVPGHDPTRFISPSALMISMGVTLLRDRAADPQAVAGFAFGSEAFEMQLADARVHTRAVTRPDASFVLSGSGNTLAAAVYGTVPVRGLIDAGVIQATGDLKAAQGFVDLFQLQAQAGL
ncbi:MAG: winged helix-turn-helix transcriptional regulator [Luteimonas sp.]